MDLTVKDAARLLQTSEQTLYRWIHDGTLPCYKVSDKYRLNRVELLEWATSRRIKVSPEIFAEEPQALPQRLLCEALRRGGVICDLEGADKKSVLQALCQALPLPPKVNREELFSVLLAREALSSTGIGNGIAIPHPRSPIVLGVTQPTVTLAFLKRPVEFGAVDGRPVTMLFAIISTTVRLHLQMLSHLMYVLQNNDFRALLQTRAGAEALLGEVEKIESQLGGARGAEGTQP